MRLKHHINFWFKYITKQTPSTKSIRLTRLEQERIEHYCSPRTHLTSNLVPANSVKLTQMSGYSYDWYQMFSSLDSRKCAYKFGDVTQEHSQPTLTKSRPINGSTNNNVLLPLDSVRHFSFINDNTHFEGKKDVAIWRGAAYQKHRKLFLTKTKDLITTDIADTSLTSNTVFGKKSDAFLSKKTQLKAKYIFAIEGNDVASNLKWVMGSNSVPIMPKPKFETWFCESKLVAGQHYIEVSDDFSNVQEVLEYYLSNPKISSEISEEGKLYALQYISIERQYAIAMEVIEKYFSYIANT